MVALQDLEVPEDIFDNVLIGFHLKCMRYFGYIISKQQRNKHFHLCKGIIFIVSFGVFFCLISIKTTQGVFNLAQKSLSCSMAATLLSLSVTMWNAFIQRKRVVRMVLYLHEDITEVFRITDKEEELMLKKTLRYIQIITIAGCAPCLLGTIVISSDTLFRTIFQPETVFNMPAVLNGTAESIILFQLYPFGEVCDNLIVGYFMPFYAMFLMANTIPLWHSFVTCLMKYIVLKYAILYKRLRDYDIAKVSINLKHEELPSLTEKELQFCHLKMCSFCIREQNKLKWFAKELEYFLMIPVCLDFIIFSISICFLLHAIIFGNPSTIDYLTYGLYIFTILLTLWLYHWHATLITHSHDELNFALYSSPWYTFPLNIQKNILLMMVDSMKPLKLKAIFVDLDIQTFISILRVAYSFFSILRSANLEA